MQGNMLLRFRNSAIGRAAVRCNMVQRGVVQRGVVQRGVVQRGVVQRSGTTALFVAALAVVASPTRAELVEPYASAITVDTDYVTGANNATDIAFSDDGRALITRKTGQVVVRRTDGSINVVNNPFGGTVDSGSEKGLLGVVADPTSENTFYFYVSNGSTSADKHRVYRAMLTEDDGIEADPSPVIGDDAGNGPTLEGPANHDGGGLMVFENQLYISVGDTGQNNTPPVNKYGSCLNKGNGKILRIGLDGSIPQDNPLVGLSAVTGCASPTGPWQDDASPDERIYAWGFRNPWRFWIDPETGLLWVGDVGEVTREEVSIGDVGEHFGYPFEEGDQVWGAVDGRSGCDALNPSVACTPAVHTYDRGGGAAVTGGLIPEGCGWEQALGQTLYLFGDSSQDWIRALPVNASRTGLTSSNAIEIGTYNNQRPVSFRMGPDEALYVVMHGAGAVYRMVPSDRSECDDPGAGGAGGGGTGGSETGGAGVGGSGNGGTSFGGTGGEATGGNAGATIGGSGGEAAGGSAGDPAGGSAGEAAGGNGHGGDVSDGGTGAPTGGSAPNGGSAGSGNGSGGDASGGVGTGGEPQGTAGDGPTTPGPTTPVNPSPDGPAPVTPSPDGTDVPGSPTAAPTGSGGAGGGDDGSGDDSGCGCRVGGESSQGSVAWLLLGLLGLAYRRKRH